LDLLQRMAKPLNARAMGLSLGIAIGVLGWISIASYWSTDRLVRSFNSVDQAHLALEKLAHIQILMEAAESGVRGYVITGQARRLDLYTYAQFVVPFEMKQIEGSLAARPSEQETLSQLNTLLKNHLRFLAGTVRIRRSDGFEAAARHIQAADDAAKRDAM